VRRYGASGAHYAPTPQCHLSLPVPHYALEEFTLQYHYWNMQNLTQVSANESPEPPLIVYIARTPPNWGNELVQAPRIGSL
jgi:hypothetical protein